jgi:DNA-binding beta-propeller fold protein YncE
MRRYPLIAILCLGALLSCSDEGGPIDNEKPAMPATPSPANAAVGQPSSLMLSWSAGGGDRFDVYLGTTTTPPLVAHNLAVSHYHPGTLVPGLRYYWRVVNMGMGAGVNGPLWSFNTAPGVPPLEPVQIGPVDDANVALDPAELTWSPEPGDSLTFNVYFGSEPDPPLAASDLAVSAYSAPVLAGNTYYWRVEAKNQDGLAASSPVWHFTALPAPGHMYNVAGTGTSGFGMLLQPPLETQLFWPQDVAFDPAGQLVVVDWNNHRVLGLNAAGGTFDLLAGAYDGKPGDPCQNPTLCDGWDAAENHLNHPTHVTFAADGKMVVAAWHNFLVFQEDLETLGAEKIVGTGRPCYDGEEKPAKGSCASYPAASVFDLDGNLIFTDQLNLILRKIDGAGMIHRFAGQAPVWNGVRYEGQRGFSGDEGPATDARFDWEDGTTCGKLCIDAAGNIYVADTSNHAVRRIDTSGIIHRFAGLYPASAGFGGDGGPAFSAQLNEPRDVACDADGNVFICDTGNSAIRMVNPAGVISTVAGIGGVTGTGMPDGRLATESGLDLPFGIEIDSHGNLWIADTKNSRIRVVYR